VQKLAKRSSIIALLASFNLFAGTSTAFSDTFNTWEGLKEAITLGDGEGIFNIEPGAVLAAAPNEYLYGGIFSGTLTGGTGDGIANINGLTRPLFESLRDASVSGLQLTAATDDLDGDGNIGITGRGLLADNALESEISNVRVAGEVHSGSYWSFGRMVSNLGGLVGTAENVIIDNSHFTGSVYGDGSNVGGLAGNLQNSTITNSSAKSSNTITGNDNVGGLVGQSFGSIIDSSVTVGLIEAVTAVGGIVGHATASDVSNSLSKSLIRASGDSVGGIAGVLANDGGTASELNSSIFKGSIVSTGDPGQVGGIVGLNYGTVENVSAIPTDSGITGEIRVGGLVGLNESTGIVRNSFFDGKVVSGGSVGGLAGLNNGLILNSAASGNIFSDENCVGDLTPGEVSCSGLIVGFNNSGTITNSASIANVYGLNTITNAADSYLPHAFPQHFLPYLNADVIPDLWEVDLCFNSNRPFKSSIKSYVSSDCESSPVYTPTFYPDYIPSLPTELAASIKESKGFELINWLSSQVPLKIVNKLSELDVDQLITSSFEMNTTREITLRKQIPLQLALSGQVSSIAEVWMQTPTGEWIKLGQVEFDEEGNAILPALKFEESGDYKLSFFHAPEWEFIVVEPKKNTAIASINLTIK
jgi:hypothetical protein